MALVVWLVKSNRVFPAESVNTRRIPSAVKLYTFPVPEPLDHVSLCPKVPVLETANAAPRRPESVKLGPLVKVSPVDVITQFAELPPQVSTTVPSRETEPIEHPLNVRVMVLLEQLYLKAHN